MVLLWYYCNFFETLMLVFLIFQKRIQKETMPWKNTKEC
jgi:hypothetical protein